MLAVLYPLAAILIRPLAWFAQRRRSQLRSLWAGEPIITIPIKARSERLLGVDARTLVYHTYFLTDAFDYNLQHWMRWPVVRTIAKFTTFCWACIKFDRLHFFCDQGLLPQQEPRQFNPHELRLYRLLKKEIFFWTYGGDVRSQQATRSLGEPNCCTECPEPGKFCICDYSTAQRNFLSIRQTAKAVFSMGDMIHDTPGSITNAFFWPVDLNDSKFKREPQTTSITATTPPPLRVVHASNHRHFKGTRHLIHAVDQLKSQGIAIDLQLVEGIPNSQALEIYRSADVIFDQCLIGFHGYLALEAMALGKAVICWIRHPQEYILAPAECPIINTRPEEIETALRLLAENRALAQELGERGRRYIQTHHTPEAFAGRLRDCYQRIGARVT